MKRNSCIFIIVFIFVSIININKLFCQEYEIKYYSIPYGYNDIDISISGNILLKQFYGQPNFGETPEIDIIESYYVLKLYEPIIFSNGLETITVEEIQLILNNNINRNFNMNLIYQINGKAYFKQTGHHHTPIIIFVNEIVINNRI